MRAFALVPLLAAPAFADYASDLLGTFNGLGLTRMSDTLKNISTSDEGKSLISLLSDTKNNFTVFAPNNQGFAGAHPNATSLTSSDPGLYNTLKYHVVSGHLANYTSNFPNTTIGRTFLNASNLVMLEGNKSQVVAWSTYGDNGTFVMNQNTPAKVVNSTSWSNLQVIVIDAVLDVPGNLSNAFVSNNLTALETVVKNIQGGSLWQDLNDRAHGFTLFAPATSVLSNPQVANMIMGLNESSLMTILGNHIVNGTTVYSSNLANGTTSASGESFNFISNSTGVFVASGNSTPVKVITPDVILKNGVMHVIDGVLLNTASNAGAASSAFQSATSAAGTAPATTETAPIGNTATMSQSGAGASGSSSGGKNGAASLGFSSVAVAVSVFGAVAGGLFTLA